MSTLVAGLAEKQFVAQVLELARLYGWRAFHFTAPGTMRRVYAGLPDLLLIRERVVWAELKTHRGKLTAQQEQVIGALRDAHAEVYVWRPSSWPEIEEKLR